jgi:Protein of unknown function (DUF2510)
VDAFVVIGWLACAGIGYAIGQKKGRAGQGFALGLLLGLIGLIIIAVMRPRPAFSGSSAGRTGYGYGYGTGEPHDPNVAPAGWHPDPSGRYQLRYWDGTRWTEHVTSNGVPATDEPGNR